jgi:hypothetical protein
MSAAMVVYVQDRSWALIPNVEIEDFHKSELKP